VWTVALGVTLALAVFFETGALAAMAEAELPL
jgi:hypothetical protein